MRGEMTGADPEFLENEEFAVKILPTLRGLKAIANYECPPDTNVSCPIFAFLGDEAEVAMYEKVPRWSQRTTSEFSARCSLVTTSISTIIGRNWRQHRGKNRVVLWRLIATRTASALQRPDIVPPRSSDAKLISAAV